MRVRGISDSGAVRRVGTSGGHRRSLVGAAAVLTAGAVGGVLGFRFGATVGGVPIAVLAAVLTAVFCSMLADAGTSRLWAWLDDR